MVNEAGVWEVNRKSKKVSKTNMWGHVCDCDYGQLCLGFVPNVIYIGGNNPSDLPPKGRCPSVLWIELLEPSMTFHGYDVTMTSFQAYDIMISLWCHVCLHILLCGWDCLIGGAHQCLSIYDKPVPWTRYCWVTPSDSVTIVLRLRLAVANVLMRVLCQVT